MGSSVEKQHGCFVDALRKSMFPKKKTRDSDSLLNLINGYSDSDDILVIQAELEKKLNELFGAED